MSISTSLPKPSAMMTALYGEKIAKIVYDRCQELGQDFNERVQSYVYEQIWAKTGLALKEKKPDYRGDTNDAQ